MHEKKQALTAWRWAAPAPCWSLHLLRLSRAQELCRSRAGEDGGRPSIIHVWTARGKERTARWFQSSRSWERSRPFLWAWPPCIYRCFPVHDELLEGTYSRLHPGSKQLSNTLAERWGSLYQKFNTNSSPFTLRTRVHTQGGLTAFSHMTLLPAFGSWYIGY